MASHRLRPLPALAFAFAVAGAGAALAEPPPTIMLPAGPDGSAAPPATTTPPPPPPPSGPQPPGPPPPPGGYVPPPPGWGPPPGYGGYDYDGPPPPVYAPRPRVYRDGLYVRLGLGLVQHRSKLSFPVVRFPAGQKVGVGNGTFEGTGFGVDAAIGGSVRPGLAIAFDFGGHDVSTPTASRRETRPDALSFSRIGALVDWYPDPKRGFHVQGGGGLASITFDYRTTTEYSLPPGGTVDLPEPPESLRGWAGHLGAGYEWWVMRDMSLGVLVRVDTATARSQGTYGDFRFVMTSPAVMFSVTMN